MTSYEGNYRWSNGILLGVSFGIALGVIPLIFLNNALLAIMLFSVGMFLGICFELSKTKGDIVDDLRIDRRAHDRYYEQGPIKPYQNYEDDE